MIYVTCPLCGEQHLLVDNALRCPKFGFVQYETDEGFGDDDDVVEYVDEDEDEEDDEVGFASGY